MATHTPTGDLLEYPIRIIDTHTLDLETDASLYAKHYAILSHTWLQAPEREVVFDEVKDIFAKVKEQWLLAIIDVITENYSYKPDILTELIRAIKNSDIMTELIRAIGISDILTERIRATASHIVKMQEQRRLGPGTGSSGQAQDCKPAIFSAKPTGPGIVKLLCAIYTARRMGYRYLWVDSCCNDQSNQKELQKALVSMGLWYANAHVCFVSLEKCSIPKRVLKNAWKLNQTDLTNAVMGHRLQDKWSTRGWTVQEIIMCRRVIFLNKEWEPIIQYDQKTLLQWEAAIQDNFWGLMSFVSLLANVPLDLVCVGQRPDVPATKILSLTISRQTTRPEDRAYSLMGILGVQMEARYGEGLPRALERLCHSITGPERKSVLDWLDKVKRNDEPELTELDFIFAWDVQVAGLNAIYLMRGLHALAKHEKESWTVGATYQFECTLKHFEHYNVNEPIQIIVDCPLAEIQDVLNGTTVWAIAKLLGSEGNLENVFLCACSMRKRAQIKTPSGGWGLNRRVFRRLYMVKSFQECGLTAKDVHELFDKHTRAGTVNWEGDLNDQHAGLGKGKNITQDLHRYLHRCREQEAAASSPDSATHVAIPWIPEEGSDSDLQIYRCEDMDQGRQPEDAEREYQCIAEIGRALNTRFEVMGVFEGSDEGNDDGDR